MSDATSEQVAAAEKDTAATPSSSDDRSERLLATVFAVGVPIATVAGAVVVGFVMGVGPALLTCAGGALLGVVGLFWGSLRTLSGEAPLPPELVEAAALRRGSAEAAERKRRAVRALKDLEHEHAVGKIDDRDYAALAADLRAQAKAAMRDLDADVAPYRSKAEALARDYLKKRGLTPSADGESGVTASKASSPPGSSAAGSSAAGSSSGADAMEGAAARPQCPKCGTPNDADAAFCKKCGTALGATAAEAS